MKPITYIILKNSLILFVAMVCIWYLTFYSSLNIPDYIPYTPIKTYSLLINAVNITVLIFAIKELSRKYPTLNINYLTLCGTGIIFVMEALFQFVLMFTNEIDRLYYYITGLFISTIFFAVISFLIAFQIKTKRTKVLIWMILSLIAVFDLITFLVKGKLY